MRLHLFLLVLFALWRVESMAPAAELDLEANFNAAADAALDVVAFYNVYADNQKKVRGQMGRYKTVVNEVYNAIDNGREYRAIVKEQIRTIERTGLYDKLGKIFYITVGKYRDSMNLSDFSLNLRGTDKTHRSYVNGTTPTTPTTPISDKYVHLAHYAKKAGEVQTLSYLQRFCHLNPLSKVLYFHNKGSYHPSPRNDLFRSLLNAFVLNPHCLSALDTHAYDTCGWRISPVPTVHYSGNFWWARCAYINQLVDPLSQQTNNTFQTASKVSKEIKGGVKGGCLYDKSRYFAESWVGSAPTIHPADCMNSSVESSFLFGNGLPTVADEWSSGLPCSTASSYLHPKVFKNTIDKVRNAVQENCGESWLNLMRRRSLLWYGQEPRTVIDWMARLDA
jgi:hypothetical protein